MSENESRPNLLQKYGGTSREAEPETKHPCFSVISANGRGGQKLVMRLKNGNRRALDYSYLPDVELEGAGQIVAHFIGHRVTIKGRNLTRVFDALVAHRLSWIAEKGPHDDDRDEAELWISELLIEEA